MCVCVRVHMCGPLPLTACTSIPALTWVSHEPEMQTEMSPQPVEEELGSEESPDSPRCPQVSPHGGGLGRRLPARLWPC